jgi:hypothetical protein
MTTMNRFRQYLAASVLTAFLIVPAVLRADCPDGTRATTEAERQEYLRILNTLNAVPPAPEGWKLRTSRSNETKAPMTVCKGPMQSVNPYEVTYVSTEQEKLNEQYRRENNARIAALRKLSPDEQKQFDDFNRQGMQLSGQSGAARRNQNPSEADRLLKEAKEFYAKSRAIQQAHADKVAPEIRAIEGDRSKYGNPEVQVQLAIDNLPTAVDSGAEKVEIPGVSLAFFDRQNALVMSFGRDTAGHNIRARLEGDRERVLTIARLFTNSSMRTLVIK